VTVADRGAPAGTVEGIVRSVIRPYGFFDTYIRYVQLRERKKENAHDIVRKVTALGRLDHQM